MYSALLGGLTGEVAIFSPDAGSVVSTNDDVTVSWGKGAKADTFNLSYSLDGGVTWVVIGKNLAGTDASWHTPTLKKNNTKVLLKIIALDASGKRVGSDKAGPFTIEALSITDPISNDTCTSGQPCLIAWNKAASMDARTGTLSYTTNGGLTWKVIARTITGSDTSYSSWVPAVTTPKSNCKVKLVYKNDTGVTVGTATSGRFTITTP